MAYAAPAALIMQPGELLRLDERKAALEAWGRYIETLVRA
jgi:hypothetical protein